MQWRNFSLNIKFSTFFHRKIPYIHQWIKKLEETITQSIEQTKQQLRRITTLDTYFHWQPREAATPKIHRIDSSNISKPVVVVQNIDETRPLPPPLPDPGNRRIALI